MKKFIILASLVFTFFSVALKLAKLVNPTEEMPVLIKLGQGEFVAPQENWPIDFQWIFFAGNGRENTKIFANKIIFVSQPVSITSIVSIESTKSTIPITGFKDIYIDSLLVLNNNFLPVNNVKILQLEKTEGQLEGIWYNAIGELQSSVNPIFSKRDDGTNSP